MNTSEKARNIALPLRLAYVCILLALVSAACVMAGVAIDTSYEAGARYFTDTPNATAFLAIMIAATVFSFVALFIFKKEPIDLNGTPSAVLWIIRSSNLIPALLALNVAYFALTAESLGQWANTILLFATVTTVFFALKILPGATVPKVISAFGVFALGAVIIASLYLDHVIELNSHFKLLVQFGSVGVILGTVADARAFLSAPVSASTDPRKDEFVKIRAGGYLFLKSISLVLCASCATATLLCFAAGDAAFDASYCIYSMFYFAHAVSSVFEIAGALIPSIKSHI